jgi:hypothetical protein
MENFSAEVKMINGRKVLMVKAKVEVIEHDGKKDVIVKVPALSIISDLKEKIGG